MANVGMTVIEVANRQTEKSASYTANDIQCAKMLAAEDHGGEVGDWLASGDRVVGGQLVSKDFDQGRIVEIDRQNVTVAWDRGVVTTQPVGNLRLEEDVCPCAWCDGLGVIKDEEHGDCECSRCNGSGEVTS